MFLEILRLIDEDGSIVHCERTGTSIVEGSLINVIHSLAHTRCASSYQQHDLKF